ncbi:Cilia- and flagella-associated protein 57 [Cichlidogyrus casuarinus]|uniref:Cilia- and flagella-associated protein 57 n=1 Tax=Cichlidogyrus casuarinus TaxID=1844966 RepID=A0ABD2QJL6_9PLAT
MAVGPNHRHIAVAERLTDRPVICIYDAGALRRKKTLSVPGEVSFVDFVSLAFSSDSKYLAALSAGPDYTLFYYSWEKGVLLASVKISTNAQLPLRELSFNPKDSTQICVIGQECFKVFRYGERILKNSVQLKVDPLDYTCHAWTEDEGLIAGTSDGTWVLVENTECRANCNLGALVEKEIEFADSQRISVEPSKKSTSITACAALGKTFLFACGPGMLHVFEDPAKNYNYKRTKEIRIPAKGIFSQCDIPNPDDVINTICFSPSQDTLLCSTKSRQLIRYNLGTEATQQKGIKADETEKEFAREDTLAALVNFDNYSQSFHSSDILGMDICARKPLIVTCSTDRTIRVWNFEKNVLESCKEFAEESFSIALHPSGLYCCVGFNDKLRLMNLLIDDIRSFKELPIRSCRECAFSNGGHLLAASLASLKGHNGKIRCLNWVVDDHHLVSCGMDGAVYEWEVSTGKRINENVLKSCQYSSVVCAPDAKTIYAVGSDTKLKEFVDSTVIKEEAIAGPLMTVVCLSKNGRMLFAGLINGMIRSFNMPLTVPPDYTDFVGHNKQIVKMCMCGNDEYLITVSEDAAVMIWKVHDREGRAVRLDRETGYAEEILITRSDLEEKNTAMQELKTRIDELKMENEYQLRIKEMNHNERLKELTEKFVQEMETLKTKNQVLRTEKEREQMRHEERTQEMLEKHAKEVEEFEATSNQKLMIEYEKLQEVQSNTQKMQEDYEARIEELQDVRQKDVEELTKYFESKLSELNETIESLNKELREQNMEGEITKRLIEEDTDREILEMKIKYETMLCDEREKNAKLRGEGGILKKKVSAQQNEIEEAKEELKNVNVETNKLNTVIKNLEKDIVSYKKEILERDETIQDKEKRIYELKKKNQELEKFKFVLDYKIKELKKQIEPREQDIKNYRDQIQEMEAELERFHKQNVQLELNVQETKQKKRAIEEDLAIEKQATREVEGALRRIKTDIYNAVGSLQEPKLLRSAVVAIYKKYIQDDKGADASNDADIQKEFTRQRDHLERSVAGLRKKLARDNEIHRHDYVRIMQQNVTLLTEINDLRKDLRASRIRVSNLEATLGLNRKQADHVRSKFAEVSRSKPNPMLELELAEAQKMLKMQRDMIQMLHGEEICKNNLTSTLVEISVDRKD